MQTPSELEQQLCAVLAAVDKPEDVKALLVDLCTDKEIEYMAQRIEAAKLMLSGCTYQQVIGQVNISTATLSRVSRCIQYGDGGYNRILRDFLKTE